MRALAGEHLLQAWQLSSRNGYPDSAVAMLQVATPEVAPEQLFDVAIPRLNLQLLRLRQISFGSVLSGFMPCLHCGFRLEFSLSIDRLLEDLQPLAAREGIEWQEGTLCYSMRPVNSRDLALVRAVANPELAPRLLLQRCITAKRSHDGPAVAQAPQPLGETARRKFDELHAASEILLQVNCPACGSVETADLDIARFLRQEVQHAAVRLLRDVHELASAYGWAEETILSMNPQRRAAYLEILHS